MLRLERCPSRPLPTRRWASRVSGIVAQRSLPVPYSDFSLSLSPYILSHMLSALSLEMFSSQEPFQELLAHSRQKLRSSDIVRVTVVVPAPE